MSENAADKSIQNPPENPARQVPDGLYVLVWISLLILTQFTVTAGQMQLGPLATIIAVAVTPAKALLVLFFFMHLRYTRPLFAVMIVLAVLTLTSGLCFTFSDYSFR